MCNELVTAVISTYNRPLDILKRAVSSILAQTYPNIEVIVVNDYPQDAALSEQIRQMLRAMNPDIIYLVHEKNQGACAARNSGLKIAKGTYIAFLDDDDEWLPEKIEKQMLQMNAAVALVGCDSYRVSGENVVAHHPSMLSDSPISAILRSNYIGSTSFPLMRTSAVRKIGGFDINVKVCQDHDLWIRMIANYPVAYVHEPLVKYYLSEDSTFKKNNQKYITGRKFLIEKYNELYMKYIDDYIFHLNNEAITGLLFMHDIRVYWVFKKLALQTCWFHRYNYTLLLQKAAKYISKRSRAR